MCEERVTFTNDYNKRRGLSDASIQFNYHKTGSRNHAKRDINDAQQLTDEGVTQFYPRKNWGNPARKNSFNSSRRRSFNRYQNQFANRKDDKYHRNGSTGIPMRGTWQRIGTIARSPSAPRQYPQPSRQYQPLRSNTPDNSAFRQSSSQDSGGCVPN